MILSTILLLSPALSPIALQQAEPQVIIRRQGVEQGQRVRVRLQEPAPAQGRVVQVHPEHQHEGQLLKVQALETEALALELSQLEAELGSLEQYKLFTEEACQDPGPGESHARIVIRFGDGREQVMEWSGNECDLPQELNAMLLQSSGHAGMFAAGSMQADCEIVESCESTSSCEEQETVCEEENVFTWAAPQDLQLEAIAFTPGQASAGVWSTEAPSGMALGAGGMDFGCDCSGCPLSSQNPHGQAAAPHAPPRQVIRLGTPNSQPHVQVHGQPHVQIRSQAQGQTDHGFTFQAAPPQRLEQPQMRLPVPPPAPLPAQEARRSAPINHRVDQLEQRLDRIEALLSELVARR